MNIFSTKNKIIFLSVLALFSFGFFANPIEVNADGCSVTNAVFRSNAGNDPDNFYHDLNRPYIYVDIQTQGCQGNNILVSIFQTTFGFQSGSILAAHNLPVGVNASTTDNFTLQFIAGEDWCGINTSTYPLGGTSGPFWDCKYSLEITDDNGEHLFATGEVSDNMNLAGGSQLVYDCVAGIFDCDHYWTAVDPLVRPYETSNINDQFNTSDTIIPPPPLEDFYLAPLPGFSQGQSSDLGGFLRSLFTLLIVIAGILAFIMIVIGAITYATADAISGKSSGKEMIQDAILGLVLALGAWIILNTINPNLASNLGITIPSVYIIPEAEPETGIGTGGVGETITLNVAGGGTTTLAACDATRMQQVTAFGKTFKIYEGLVSSIQAADAQWVAAGGQNFYEIKSIGGYNCRKVKGTNTWSAHAFGVAVDINPGQNPFSPASQNQLTTDMPPAFVQIWTGLGWGWGGAWTTLKDAMHFSKYPPSENGNGVVTQ